MSFLAAVSRRLNLLHLPHLPLGSQVFLKIDVTGSLTTNKLAVIVHENPVHLAAHLQPVKSRGFHCFGGCLGYLPT